MHGVTLCGLPRPAHGERFNQGVRGAQTQPRTLRAVVPCAPSCNDRSCRNEQFLSRAIGMEDPMTVVSGRVASATDLNWAVSGLEVETPSWGYGNSGTRFKVFPQPGVPRDPFEK